jgi:hypothetical protein
MKKTIIFILTILIQLQAISGVFAQTALQKSQTMIEATDLEDFNCQEEAEALQILLEQIEDLEAEVERTRARYDEVVARIAEIRAEMRRTIPYTPRYIVLVFILDGLFDSKRLALLDWNLARRALREARALYAQLKAQYDQYCFDGEVLPEVDSENDFIEPELF